mgnify:CR=1 FL=1
MNKKILISLILIVGFTLPALSQTPDVYWGLNWSMSETQIDSALQDVFKDKKLATKTNYTDNRQLSGYSYRFKQAYFEKYGHVFEENAAPYQTTEGTSVVLRSVKEPTPGVLGQTVFQVSMLSPNPFEMTEENMDFLF